MDIVNLLATTQFAEYLDLDTFSEQTDREFEPDRFPGMSCKLETPKVCVLLFRSGRVVVTGAKQISDIESALTHVFQELKDNGHEHLNENYGYEIGNVVVTHNIGEELNLADLTMRLPFTRTEWEPEQFPGLIYRVGRGLNSVALVFSSGKCVITGNTTIEDAQSASEYLTEDLLACLES